MQPGTGGRTHDSQRDPAAAVDHECARDAVRRQSPAERERHRPIGITDVREGNALAFDVVQERGCRRGVRLPGIDADESDTLTSDRLRDDLERRC